MTRKSVLRWPATWALLASIALASFAVAVHSCSVIAEATGFDIKGAIRRHIAALAGREQP